MKQKWERNRYPHTVNNNRAVHENTQSWLEELLPASGYQPTEAHTFTPSPVALADTAARLAAEYNLPAPKCITWEPCGQRWGTCNPSTQTITINPATTTMPAWVLDGIIMHELAHLVTRGHGPDFVALVNRYPLARETDGYLAYAQTILWGITQEPHLHRDQA